jgi:CheY-like chemotaxis protein/HPt (histidine-containing phosphotransfer) domain-containing protein
MQIADAARRHHDTAVALAEAVRKLLTKLASAGQPSLVLAYADARHDPQRLAEQLAQTFPVAAVPGGRSCLGAMTSAGFHTTGTTEQDAPPALGLLGITDAKGGYGVGLATLGTNPRAAAAQATEAALVRAGRPHETPGLVWVCAAPGAEEEVLAGIAEVVGPSVPVFGGSSADNEVAGNWWQIGSKPKALRGGLAVAVLFPSTRIGHAFQGGYESAGPVGRVTAARDRAVLAIDGMPAAEVYRGWTQGRIGVEPATILADSTCSPAARSVGAVEGVPFWLLADSPRVTATPQQPLLNEADEPLNGAGLRHCRGALVLVAKDNDVNQAVARALLEGLGLRVLTAADGQQAIDAAARQAPDLVLMDLQMPVLDGVETTRRLRTAGYKGPVVACTANVLPEALAAVRAAGANRVLSKPIDRADLLDMLAEALPMPTPPAPRPMAIPECPPLRTSALFDLIDAIGAEAVAQAANLFRDSARERVTGTLVALAAGDMTMASRHAHALKSPAAMLGAQALSETMATIEQAAMSRDRTGAEAAAGHLTRLLAESLAALDQALAEAA